MIKINSLDRVIKLAFNKLIKKEKCLDDLSHTWDVMDTYKTINNLPMYAQYYINDVLNDWDNWEEGSYENEEYKIIELDGEMYICEMPSV